MGVKLLIGICANRHEHPQFRDAYGAMCSHLGQRGIKDINMVESQVASQLNASELCTARQDIIVKGMKAGFTHILFIDNDSTFPPNLCDYLFSHGKDVVGVNTCRKNSRGNIYTALDMEGKPLESMGKQTLVEVSAIGMGILLVSTRALSSVPLPHFEVLWDSQLQCHQSETRYFSRKLRKCGIQLWCDQMLSHICGHMGDQNFNYSYYQSIGITR